MLGAVGRRPAKEGVVAVSAANPAARKQSRQQGRGRREPPHTRAEHAGSSVLAAEQTGAAAANGRPASSKPANGKQNAGKGAKAAEPAGTPQAQETETWVQDTADSELAIDSLDHPADLDAVVDIAVVEVDVDVEIDVALDDPAL